MNKFFSVLGLLMAASSAYSAPLILDMVNPLAEPKLLEVDQYGYPFDPSPSYTYSYQVADAEESTYIAQSESRDGALVTGEYSYVDPNGALVTVKYEADEAGYRETRTVQDGFLYSADSAFGPAAPVIPKPVAPVVARPRKQSSDLIAKIIAQLTPYIKSTVSETLASA